MAHFRGTLKGTRGQASRLGSKKSGLVVTANGWDIGGRIELDHTPQGDLVRFSINGGSNGRSSEAVFANFLLTPAGPARVEWNYNTKQWEQS